MNRLKYLFNFFINYKNILLEVFYYEVLYSFKYLELPFFYIKIHKNSKFETDSVPCLYYYL